MWTMLFRPSLALLRAYEKVDYISMCPHVHMSVCVCVCVCVSVCVCIYSRYDHHHGSSYSAYNAPRYHAHRPNSDGRPFRREYRPGHSAAVPPPPFNASSDRFVDESGCTEL